MPGVACLPCRTPRKMSPLVVQSGNRQPVPHENLNCLIGREHAELRPGSFVLLLQKRTPSTVCFGVPSQICLQNNYGLTGLAVSGGWGAGGPPRLVGSSSANPTRSPRGSCRRGKGHFVALLGSLNNFRMTVSQRKPHDGKFRSIERVR